MGAWWRTPRPMLGDAEFVVQKGGWRRARHEGRRNVHAWARGRVMESGMGTTPEAAESLPRLHYDLALGAFVLHLTKPPVRILSARCAAFNARGAFGAYLVTERL